METTVQTTDILITATDQELKVLLQAEVALFEALKQGFGNDGKELKNQAFQLNYYK